MIKKIIKEFDKKAGWLKEGIVYHRGKHNSIVKENTLEAIVYASSRPEKILCEGKEISFEYNECEKKVYAKLEKSLEDIESSVKYEFIF